VLNEEASAAGPGFVTLSGGSRLRFDCVIVATGTRFEPFALPGSRKAGVFVLDGADKYDQLGRACASMDVAVVVGEGYRGLEVADRLSSRGTRVRLMISCWQCEPPSPVVLEVIEDAARESGAEIKRGEISRVAGNGAVEAAVAGGSVVPCDAVVVVPPRTPNPVHASVELGHGGAIEVDRRMRASAPSVFAAGGCAELKGSAPGSLSLSAEPFLSGRIAGSNCAGSAHSIGGTRVDELRAFRLRWSRIGPREGAPAALSKQAATVSRRWGSDCACSIAHEKFTERVVGVESIQPWASSPAGLPPLAAGVTLEALAFGLGSSDISPISETARLGLREWPGS
jgi:NADPH-dependent 2,4-dienoyl-CoA reductase/sulfur reductase-like enzyme